MTFNPVCMLKVLNVVEKHGNYKCAASSWLVCIFNKHVFFLQYSFCAGYTGYNLLTLALEVLAGGFYYVYTEPSTPVQSAYIELADTVM